MSKDLAAGLPARDERAVLAQERSIVRLLSLLLVMGALGYYASHGYLLLYGDAVAHLHIARRVFDSLNPGFRQLGSVWLPLPHLLLLPFVQKMSWWRNGLAGAVPSVLSYVAGCVGIYRLSRHWMPIGLAAVAVLFYGLNPGLIYLSTTAMTEPLYLAEMVWAVVLLVELGKALATVTEAGNRRASHLLLSLGLLLAAAVFTRYDGWGYAALSWLAATVMVLRSTRMKEMVGGAWVLFTAIVGFAPLLWLAYSAKQFHDPFDFLRGPYSAKAIELRTATPGAPHYPGFHSWHVAAMYFMKAAELDTAWPRCGTLLLIIAIVGTGVAVFRFRNAWTALLFWLPLPFYAYSVAWGSVPMFIPVWWPFSFYNTRYGMEMLPAFALFSAFAIAGLIRLLPMLQKWLPLAAALLVVGNSAAVLHARPLVLREAMANGRARISFEHALAVKLADIPAHERILMYTAAHVGALQQAGVPLKQTLNEGDDWRWRVALDHPARSAQWVVAMDGDAVAEAVKEHPEDLDLLSVTCASDQGCARIYHSSGARVGLGGGAS